MGLISSVFYLFTPYTDARERAVGRFFKGLTEHGDQTRARERLSSLLQTDIAVINLWSEYRYKGYRYLHKWRRRKLYANLQRIATDFDRLYQEEARPADAVVARIHDIVPGAAVDPARAVLLQALMDYFSPGRGRYVYRESSSFGRLLRNPSHEKLIGDCNQIVTLYLYLYSRYYDVHDLKVHVLPGHVALHYGGIDIETTNGTFADYREREGGTVLPVEEIVSVNLLDTTDAYLSTHAVAPQDFLQASRFAFILSHDRPLAKHNLDVAYKQLVRGLMQRHNFKQALRFAEASRDRELLGIVGHNGAIHAMEQHNYKQARLFASYAADSDALIRQSWSAEGFHHYQERRYHDAIRAYKHIGDQTRVRQCYEALFFAEQNKLGSHVNSESIKQHAKTIKRMHGYAKKSGNKKLIEHTASLQKQL
jgi:hypothetical protein